MNVKDLLGGSRVEGKDLGQIQIKLGCRCVISLDSPSGQMEMR